MRFYTRRDDDGKDDVTAFFLSGRVFAHDSADGLNNIHLRAARGEEEDGIERGHVHSLGKTTDIAEDAAGVFPVLRP